MLKAVCLYAFPDLALEFLVAASTEHTETGDFPDSFFFALNWQVAHVAASWRLRDKAHGLTRRPRAHVFRSLSTPPSPQHPAVIPYFFPDPHRNIAVQTRSPPPRFRRSRLVVPRKESHRSVNSTGRRRSPMPCRQRLCCRSTGVLGSDPKQRQETEVY
jgi:hypothetical protein